MKTLYDKIWENHVVYQESSGPALIYVDLHLIHEVTSPQAFDALLKANRAVRRPDLTIGTMDHSVPTLDINRIQDIQAALQLEAFRENCKRFGVKFFDLGSENQGIVHVFAPELGLVQPGMTIVCGDSHTSTHGAFAALAFGIGSTEVEQVLATQCLYQMKSKNFLINISGNLPQLTTAKDLILHVIAEVGVDGANGYVIEYAGDCISSLSMEERMTICNMSIEAGARAGLIAPDEKTFNYLEGKPYAPKGTQWEKAIVAWAELKSDENASFDRTLYFDASEIEPQVTWGTTPAMVSGISGVVPDPGSAKNELEKIAYERAISYMGLEPLQRITDIKIDRAFIGSCTNSRIEDLRAAARVVKGYKVHPRVKAMIVPGSQNVKKQAEIEGLAEIFLDAGFEWRNPGCSMCIAMNGDSLLPKERCASTSNRNFEGRQGRGGRTHLASPMMVAAAAIAGHFVDIRDWKFK
ncbi:MAG: 3-isopropylmalate dehydratase large subunit [Acidobacteria bacterium]|nr:MAG: 3-isopropylmalate dehydratase large subunit [Acidobacteriota bacterium]